MACYLHNLLRDSSIYRGADLFKEDSQGSTPFMVAIAAGQKDILRNMLDSALKVLDVTGQNASIVLWAIENDHVTLLQVCYYVANTLLVYTIPIMCSGNMGTRLSGAS